MRSKVMGSIQIALLAIILATPVWAQPPMTLWTKIIDSGGYDGGLSIKQTDDGGFIVAGSQSTQGNFWLIKLNAFGDQEWQRTYGGCVCYEVQQTSDGGYIMAGYTYTTDVYVVKTDASGNLLWRRTYGWGGTLDLGYSVQQTNDGGYIIGGTTYFGGVGSQDFWLIKINADGDTIWTRTFGGQGIDCGLCARQTNDGGYIFIGDNTSYGAGGIDILLVKTDSLGNQIWQHTYGGGSDDAAGVHCVEQTDDGGYILIGTTFSYSAGGADMWLIKTDANGDTLWTRTYGGTDYDDGRSVQQTSDGGFILCGIKTGYGFGGNDFWLVKTDAAGDSLWSCTFGGAGNDVPFEIRQTSDEGYVTVGNLNDNWYAGISDIYVVRLAGPAIGQVAIALDPVNPPIVIPPQGGAFSFNITLTNDSTTYQAYNVWCSVELPNGLQYPVLGPIVLAFPPGFNMTRLRTQAVPDRAPAGDYIYWGCIGYPPWTVLASDSFSFVKEGAAGDWPGLDGWLCTGESFPGEKPLLDTAHQPTSPILHPCRPNPFNPTTAISFELRAASFVKLAVYDISGRTVTTLVDGWQEAGTHEVTFDGSGLPSGIYIYRLEAGDHAAGGKMVLMK